jgi:hypothetical protein
MVAAILSIVHLGRLPEREPTRLNEIRTPTIRTCGEWPKWRAAPQHYALPAKVG